MSCEAPSGRCCGGDSRPSSDDLPSRNFQEEGEDSFCSRLPPLLTRGRELSLIGGDGAALEAAAGLGQGTDGAGDSPWDRVDRGMLPAMQIHWEGGCHKGPY